MKFFFNKLEIFTNDEKIIVKEFSKDVTFYHGPTSHGKSTILRILDFCLGQALESTEEIQTNFKGAKLNMEIGRYHVELERYLHHDQIKTTYTDSLSMETNSVYIPESPLSEAIIPDAEVYSISDLFFYLSGVKIPFVRRQRYDDDSDLQRLSFRDLMWYCYLNQDEMTSSLFYLERADNYFKHMKSRDVLRYVLKYRVDKIAELENDFHKKRQEQMSLVMSITKLKQFLTERGIDNADTLNLEHSTLLIKLEDVKNKIENIRNEIESQQTHPLDKLRNEANQLSVYLREINDAIDDCNLRLAEQERLHSEFMTSSMKIRRTNAARRVFKDVEFNRCPQCGEVISVVDPDHCTLCKQVLNSNIILDADVNDLDLDARIKELSDSISRLHEKKILFERQLESKIYEKRLIDQKLVEESKNYDTEFLARARNLEERKGILSGQIQLIEKLLPLPNTIDELEIKNKLLLDELQVLKDAIRSERSRVQADNESLQLLKTLFKETLLKVKFPDFTEKDTINISPNTFYPQIRRFHNGVEVIIDFNNLGSAGKKNIFKTCYAMAIHKTTTQIKSNLPTFMIFDTPMANLSETEDKEIFQSFYQFLYELISNELKGQQIILIDKEFHGPIHNIPDLIIKEERMDENNPLF